MACKARLPPLPSVRDVLKMYQITAKKNLSQNFILDPRILEKIAKTAGNLKDKYVIEVGPGPGGITRALLTANPKQVLVIEKDPRFIPSLKLLQEAAGGENKLKINIGDCLFYNIEKLIPESVSVPWDDRAVPDVRLVGNLPFNVATPFIIRLLNSMANKNNIFHFGRVPSLLTFQHEVAHRMTAMPNDPERCRLSIMCQNYASVDYLFTLPGGAFVPPPQVDVGVVRLTPLRMPYICSDPETPMPFDFLNRVVTTLFHNKQKFIRTNISNLFPKGDFNFSREMANTILDMTDIKFDRKAISLTIDEIEKICVAYHQLCVDKNIPDGFVHPQVKAELDRTDQFLTNEETISKLEEKPQKYDIQF